MIVEIVAAIVITKGGSLEPRCWSLNPVH